MTAPKTVPIITGTTKKLSGNGRRGDLDGEGASILSTHLSVAPVFRGCGGRMVQGHRLVALPSTQWHRSPFLSALSDFHGFCKSSGSFAMFTANRRASSLVSNLAADLRPGSSSK